MTYGDDNRIPVEVHVSTFRGHGTHVYVVMRERPRAEAADRDAEKLDATAESVDQDPSTGGSESGVGNGHPSGTDPTGTERMMKFHSREAAERWIDYTYTREFGEMTHRLVFVDDIQQRWFYREGD